MITNQQQRESERLLIGAIAGLVLIRFVLLFVYPVLDRSEARYATVAMRMADKGDWITPTIDGVTPFWAKPPLAFWLSAASDRLFGVNEFASRLPSLLIYLAIMWLVFVVGREARDRIFGLLAACVFASMGLAFYLAGSVMTDPALALGITASMVAFWFAMNGEGLAAGYAVFAAFGWALLAKGPIGVLLPGASMLTWAIWNRRFSDLFRRLPVLSGSALMLAIAVPWYALAEQKTPGFLNYFIVGEHFHRYLDPGWKGDLYGSGRRTPLGAIWLFTLAATLPWSGVAVWAALRKRIGAARDRRYLSQPWFRFLLTWSLVPLVFFSLARNTIITYALPSAPPLALLAAHLLRRLRWFERPRQFLAAVAMPVAVVAIAGVASWINPGAKLVPSQAGLVELWKKQSPQADDALVYLFETPFSANFYTRGRAVAVMPEKALEMLRAGEAHTFAVAAARLPDVPTALQSELTETGEANRTVLLSAKPRGAMLK